MKYVIRIFLSIVMCLMLVSLLHHTVTFGEPSQSAIKNQPADQTIVPKSMQCTADSLGELRRLKAELLLEEFSLRHQNVLHQENMFTVLRVLLLIVVIGSMILIYIKAKSSQTEISRLAIVALIIILISVYWYDNFIIDAQKRINDRIGTIPYILNQVPTMSGDELRALPIFENLTWPVGLGSKVELFFARPNFAQIISYVPILVVIVLLIFRRQALRKK
jgi:hypothetical protein